MKGLPRLLLVWKLAWTQFVGHRRTNLFTGALLAVNAALIVFGVAVIGSVQSRTFAVMSRSMMGSFQIYSAAAREPMSVIQAAIGMGSPDIGTFDFVKAREFLRTDPNVKTVVPMGTLLSECILPNQLEIAVETLRIGVRDGPPERVAAGVKSTRDRLGAFAAELKQLGKVVGTAASDEKAIALVNRAMSDDFWRDFEKDPQAAIVFLEEEVVPLAGDTEVAPMALIGVDHEAAREGFSSWRLVAGQWVPKNHRGLLIIKSLWDLYYEYSISRELNRLYKDVVVDKTALAPAAFKDRAAVIAANYEQVTLQLDRQKAEWMTGELRSFLGVDSGELPDLLKTFLNVDADNLAARHAFFYKTLAPKIRLHRIEPGDDVLLKAWGEFPSSISVKFYGVIELTEFKDVVTANNYNRIDLVSFGVLDGELTTEMKQEFDSLKGAVKFNDGALGAIDDLFKSTDGLLTDDSGLAKPDQSDFALAGHGTLPDTFTQEQIDRGRVEQAAVFLHDEARTDETVEWVERESASAGVALRTGGPPQVQLFVSYNMEFFRYIMTAGAFIVFVVIVLVSLLTISISVIGRLRELGILRAIGAPARVATSALLLEMTILGFAAGCIGAALGVGLVKLAGVYGIPAVNPALMLLFAGKKLFPTVTLGAAIAGVVAATVVVWLATLYPARMASRAEPIFAVR